VATHPDRICPTDEEIVLPDCAAICACLETATGRAPDAILGKPDPRMVFGSLRGRDVPVGEVAVVGDRLYTDLRMARESGALGVLVLSGETTRGQAEAAPGAYDLAVESLAELGALLAGSREA
jgi:NagD protein